MLPQTLSHDVANGGREISFDFTQRVAVTNITVCYSSKTLSADSKSRLQISFCEASYKMSMSDSLTQPLCLVA